MLDHEFDCKHYRVNAGSVRVDIREGLKVLENERMKWEQETREKQQQELEEKQRVRELQRKSGRGF